MAARPQVGINISTADKATTDALAAAVAKVLTTAYEVRASESVMLAALSAFREAASLTGLSVNNNSITMSPVPSPVPMP